MAGQPIAPVVAPPIGQILYAIQDTTVIWQMPEQPFVAGCDTLSFSGSVQEPRANRHDWIPLDRNWVGFGGFDDLQSARTVTQWRGKQAVVLITKKGLMVHSSTKNKASWQVDNAVRVIGIDPLQTTKNFLALMVSAGAGFAVVLVDMDTGVPGDLRHLPAGVQGKLRQVNEHARRHILR